eukprot:586084-Rhodomonas_salina.2
MPCYQAAAAKHHHHAEDEDASGKHESKALEVRPTLSVSRHVCSYGTSRRLCTAWEERGCDVMGGCRERERGRREERERERET